ALSFAETQEQAAETNTLYEISSRLAQANSRAEVLESIGGYAQSNGASSVMLLYLDTDENDNPIWADVVADLAISGTTGSSVGQRFYLPDLPFAKLWISNPNSPLLIDDITNTDRVSDPVTVGQYTANGIYGSALVPLRVNNRWVGMIVASWDKPHQFTELDQRIYSAIAQQTAAVVNSTRLFEHTEKSARELQTVTRVSAASSSILNVDELLQSVADLTRDGFNLYHAHIYLLDDTGKNLVLAAGAGETGRIMKANHHSIPAAHEHSLVARAARTRRGVIANDVTKEPDFLPNPLLPDTKSELAVPMIVGGKLIGILDVQSERLDRFDNADANIKRTLAEQVAVAVQNARAFEYQQEVSDRLREVDRLKSQFLANMSHELRTPLNSVIGYAEVMLDGDDGELSSEAVQDVQIIYDSGKHLLSIINDILDLAKIEAGQMHIDRREVNLVKELEEIIRAGQVLVKDKPVELLLVSDGDFEHVMADPIRMRQIVWNLVSNAIKFTEQGSVTLRLSERIAPNTANDKEVCVHVNDTGMGIEPENLEMVFERFQQADGSSTRRAGGTGLGLTITRHLVQLHGGEIYAESEIGAGSSFWFTLPANVN
ncbi:MAG: GAF domain-containing protein, partial [Burkholderiales bacterium]|nr:GAF domain-containing protein [Anaerolineae bacterium]